MENSAGRIHRDIYSVQRTGQCSLFVVHSSLFIVKRYSMLVTGCWLLVTGYWLLVAGCWLLEAGCWLLVSGCWLLVSGCWLLVSGCWFLVAGFWFLAKSWRKIVKVNAVLDNCNIFDAGIFGLKYFSFSVSYENTMVKGFSDFSFVSRQSFALQLINPRFWETGISGILSPFV